jgi:hypothetical protein
MLFLVMVDGPAFLSQFLGTLQSDAWAQHSEEVAVYKQRRDKVVNEMKPTVSLSKHLGR